MADPIKGTLEIRSDPGDVAQIVLDPNKADITAGGIGGGGDLILKNAQAIEVIRLGQITESVVDVSSPTPIVVADYAGLRIRTAAGVNLVQIGRKAVASSQFQVVDEIEVIVGGNGFAGTLRLVDKTGKTRFVLGQDDLGQEGRLIVFSANSKKLLEFDPVSATLYIGGETNGGDVIVRDATGQERIKLSGDGTIRLRSSSDAKDRIQLIADRGKIVLGGNGENGDLLVFAEGVKGADLADRGKEAAIWIRGGQGDILLANGDCAEDFDVSGSDEVEPGTVMVLDREGRLVQSTRAYDKKVAGVISGAGDHKPGIVLDRKRSQDRRHPVALLGKTYCKVDARYAPIEVGDLLTTSPTRGHAMKATDPLAAFGAVIGKALRPLAVGSGLIPVLIALQ